MPARRVRDVEAADPQDRRLHRVEAALGDARRDLGADLTYAPVFREMEERLNAWSKARKTRVTVDDAYVATREAEFAKGGVLRGRELARTFASLRANDLIWPYVVNNYLKGNTPPPFDLLYWNSDSTNLPGAMYAYYVRNTYLENNLRTPGKLTMCGMPVDLGRIDMPAYVLAAREDHIVPWRTAYATNRLLGGPTQFVLAASGHIAGVINPPERKKRNYWLNADSDAEAETWISGAASRDFSL